MNTKHYLITNRPLRVYKGKLDFAIEGNRISSSLFYGYLNIDENYEVRPEIIGIEEEKNIDFSYNKIKEVDQGLSGFFKQLYHEMRNTATDQNGKNDVMVFIHGYGHSIKKSFAFLRLLHKRYVENPESSIKKIVMIMWPSKAHVVSYYSEQSDAEYTGNLLGNFYFRLHQFNQQYASAYEQNVQVSNKGYMHLLVQSMGNKVLEKMFTHIEYGSPRIAQSFKEIIMVGADIKNDVFEPHQTLEKLPDLCSRVHVYCNQKDLALGISRVFNLMNNFQDRRALGVNGPNNINMISERIKVVDVTNAEDFMTSDNDNFNDFADDNIIQHRYFLYSSMVINDIIKVMKGEASEKIAERKVKYAGRWYKLEK
jgi:esterase/lipase superfamily enzyme